MANYNIKARANSQVTFDFDSRMVKFQRTGVLNTSMGIVSAEFSFDEITGFVATEESEKVSSCSLIINGKALCVYDKQGITENNVTEVFLNSDAYQEYLKIIDIFCKEVRDVPVTQKGQGNIPKEKYIAPASAKQEAVPKKAETAKHDSKFARWCVAKLNPFVMLVAMVAAALIAFLTIEDFAAQITAIVVIFVIGIAFMIWLAVYAAKVKKEIDQAQAELDAAISKISSVSNTRKGYIVKITATDPILGKVFHLVDYMNKTIAYEPEKLHIGAVTVGGVTTGGVYTTGGYNYVSKQEKSGHYHLAYKNYSVGLIELPKNLYKKAEKSPIAEYLEDGCYIRVVKPIPLSQMSEIDQKLMVAKMKETGYVGNFPELYPTQEKATVILNWLMDPSNND